MNNLGRNIIAAAAMILMPSSLSFASEPTTIVILIDVIPGQSQEKAKEAMDALISFIGMQPGFIDDRVLENKYQGNSPKFVHIMQWNEQKDWEAMFMSESFNQLGESCAKYFTIKPADVFLPANNK